MGMIDINNAAGAQNALTARMNGFLDTVDADIAARQAVYDAHVANFTGIVASEMDQTHYVDNTLAEAAGDTFPTIKEAVDALPAVGRFVIRPHTGQTHIIDADIELKARTVLCINHGDLGLGAPIIQPQAYLAGGVNCMYGFSGTAYSAHIGFCNVALPAVEPDPNVAWNPQKRSLFLHHRTGHRDVSMTSSTVTGGVAGTSLGVVSVHEAGRADFGVFVVTLDGPIFGVINGAEGVFTIRHIAATIQNGAGLNDGGTIGVNFLKN